jgi:hypothetical protein
VYCKIKNNYAKFVHEIYFFDQTASSKWTTNYVPSKTIMYNSRLTVKSFLSNFNLTFIKIKIHGPRWPAHINLHDLVQNEQKKAKIDPKNIF